MPLLCQCPNINFQYQGDVWWVVVVTVRGRILFIYRKETKHAIVGVSLVSLMRMTENV